MIVVEKQTHVFFEKWELKFNGEKLAKQARKISMQGNEVKLNL